MTTARSGRFSKQNTSLIWILQIAVAIAYLISGVIIHLVFKNSAIASVIWPGSGIALAALLLVGNRLILGIFIGSLLLNVISQGSPVVVVGMTLANVLEAQTGYWLLTRGNRTLQTLRTLPEFLWLLAFGGGMASIIGAIIGMSTLVFAGYVTTDLVTNYIHWWIGDTLGVTLFTSLILSWWGIGSKRLSGKFILESLILISLTFVVGQIVFLDWFSEYLSDTPKAYWLFLSIAIIAIRLGTRGTTLVLVITAIQALLGAYQEIGFFAHDIVKAKLYNYGAYMLILSIVGMIISAYIDEIRRKEEQVSDIANHSQLILDSISEGLHGISRDGKIIFENPSATNMLGWQLQEMIGQPAHLKIHHTRADGSLYPQGECPIYATLDDGVSRRIQDEVFWRKDGTCFPVDYTSTPMRNTNGEIIGAIVSFRDISERLNAEHALKESEARFRRTLEHAPIGMATTSLQGNFILVNQAYCDMLGFTRKELEQLTFQDITHPEDKTLTLPYRQQLLDNKIEAYQLEKRYLHKNGQTVWAQITSSLERNDSGEPIFFIAQVEDITERKYAAVQMKEIEQRYRTLADSGRALIWTSGTDKLCDYFNKVWLEFTGRSIEQEIGNGWTEGVHPEDLQHCQDIYVSSFDNHQKFDMDYRLRRHDGEYRWIRDEGCPRYDSEGQFMGYIGYCTDITERKLAEVALQESERSLKESQTIGGLGSYVLDIPSGIWKSSDVFDKIFGIDTTHDHSVAGWVALLHPDDRMMMSNYFRNEVLKECKAFDKEYRIIRQNDHSVCWVHGLGKLEFDELNQPLKMHGTIQDITERKQIDDELRIAAVAFASQNGMLITDPLGIILRVNPAFTRLTGYSAEEAFGKTPAILSSGRQDKLFYQRMWDSLKENGYWQGEIWNKRKNGQIFAEMLNITAIIGSDGHTTHYVGSFTDITESKEAEAKIHRLAYYDPLTSLPNRRLMQDRLGQALAATTRSGLYGAIFFIDLDNFKALNDTRGHDVGDLLLFEVAKCLKTVVREGDTVARQGGDEFVVLMEDMGNGIDESAALAKQLGDKLRDAIDRPFLLNGYEYHCKLSIGVSLFSNKDTVDNLLKHADLALYQAKNAGRNTLRFFDPAMQAALELRSALDVELHQALKLNQLRLFYQPQVDSEGHILSVEALLRWQHPHHGLVLPDEFITLAEDTGFILPIGLWVLETACAQLKAWENDVRSSSLQISVNVSARQFRQSDFVAQVQGVIESSRINPKCLKIEMTESMVLDDIEDTINKMNAIKRLGVCFSMDDFGTGFSSLSYLSQLPLDQIKIDRSFVQNLPGDRNGETIARTIITMGIGLSMNVIAEGVETEDQFNFLKTHGCNAYQGYLFSRPLPIQELEAFLLPKKVTDQG